MKKIIAYLLFFLPIFAHAQGALSQAQTAYEKNDYAAALTLYRQAAQTAQGDELAQIQLHIIASQYMLGEYLNAAQSAFSFPLPDNTAAKARLLLYRIKTAQRVKERYRAILSDTAEDHASLAQLTPQQWDEKISESFDTLWKMRNTLIAYPIQQETFIINFTDTDTQAIPTLFDFVVLLWKEYLLTNATPLPLAAAKALHTDFSASVLAEENTQRLLSILSQASQLGGSNRANAKIIWKAQKILLPFENPHLFTFDDKQKQLTQAADLLAELAGNQSQQNSWWKKILSFSNNQASYGQSYAAFQAAALYNQAEDYEQAVSLCRWATRSLPANYYTSYACADLVQIY